MIISSRILRYSFAILFLWFGFQQLMGPEKWISFLPVWTGYVPIPAEILIRLNGWFEIIGAFFLLTGTFVKQISVLLALHLFAIALETGGAIGMRDGILAMMGIALAFAPTDSWTVDAVSK